MGSRFLDTIGSVQSKARIREF
ncbi:hypothetical protein MXB_4747 [Myxobolus squamalis]|nr:hypothetical protein MXB_4747 [Myxobolus squamalis]